MDVDYNEPFDEIMGMNPKKNVQTSTDDVYSPAIVSPDPSPTASELVAAARRTSSPPSSGPPSNAFVHTSSQDRWAQYEMDDDRLKEESAMAHATAVASAAERAAMRDLERSHGPDDEFAPPTRRYYDDPEQQGIEMRLEDAGPSLPPPEPRSTRRTSDGASPRAILHSLSKGRGLLSGMGNSSRYEEEEILYDDPNDRVRAEAMKMLKLADEKTGGSSLRRTPGGGFTSSEQPFQDRSSRRHVPAALSGLTHLGGSSESPRRPYRDDRFAIGSDDEMDDDHDLVDVVERERGGGNFDMKGEDKSTPNKSWSSRYSVNNTMASLSAGTPSSSIRNSFDNRQARSARNMYSTSPHEGGVFGSGFSFRQSGKQETVPSSFNLQNHRTVWMDVDLNKNGNSLSPITNRSGWQSELERKRRRRRCCVAGIVVIILAIILGVVFGATNAGGGVKTLGAGGETVTFYVTADVPYDSSEDKKLAGDLLTLPGDAEFAVHLGNIQDSSVTLCPESVYLDASAVLAKSPVPMFVVPGQNDWTNCPKPDYAFSFWQQYFLGFDEQWASSFRTDSRDENFSFLYRGVLFIGVHLVGGRVHDKEAWTTRHNKNVEWTEEKLSEHKNNYRAVVILGNARPSQQQDEYFLEVVDDLRRVGVPAMYIHANGGGGLKEYQPFPSEASNLLGVQIDDGGKSPPLRVTVGFGNRPFQIG